MQARPRPKPRDRRSRTLWAVAALGVFALAFWCSTYVVSYRRFLHRADPFVRTDFGRLRPTRVRAVEHPNSVEEIQRLVRSAAAQRLKISIAGRSHSQGGQTVSEDGLVLDMRHFNAILHLDETNRILTVQSGATWDQIQRVLAPRHLAVKVMQSSNIFTVGGTLSANAHGRDLDVTSMVETVRAFRLVLPDGSVVQVSRTQHPELFRQVIGGYGLFGVILDVDMYVTDDVLLERSAEAIDYHDFPSYFAARVKADPHAVLMLARPSISTRGFLEEMIVTVWRRTDRAAPAGIFALTEERNVLRDRLLFGLSRDFDWAKSLRWSLQKRVESSPGRTVLLSRNNAMRPPAAPVAFLDYEALHTTDLIQEYYIPTSHFVAFMDDFRRILREGKMNVISATVRYVRANDETSLSYSPREDAFAIIQMSTIPLSPEGRAQAERVTRALVDAALAQHGTYYLTYQLYPTSEQLVHAYPKAQEVFQAKRDLDPTELFSNQLYERYAPDLLGRPGESGR